MRASDKSGKESGNFGGASRRVSNPNVDIGAELKINFDVPSTTRNNRFMAATHMNSCK